MTVLLVERDFASFFATPFAIYPSSSPFVSPLKNDLARMLDPRKNPFFHDGRGEGTYYTAVVDGRPAGRILCHVNHASNLRWDERAACFGFFDCVDDDVVAQALLSRAEEHARRWGCTLVRGNMNMTPTQEAGIVVDGYDEGPRVGLVWNPPHITRLLQSFGYASSYPATTFVCRDVATRDWDQAIAEKHRTLAHDDAFIFRTVDMSQYRAEVQRIRVVLNEAMHDNKLFVDLTPAEMEFQLGPYEQVLDPRLVWICEHKGEVVGASLATPDFLPLLKKMKSRLWPLGALTFLRERKHVKGASVIIIVVKKEFQSKGIVAVLNWKLSKAMQAAGYQSVSGTWIADTNIASLKQAERMGFTKLHRWDLFEKQITNAR